MFIKPEPIVWENVSIKSKGLYITLESNRCLNELCHIEVKN